MKIFFIHEIVATVVKAKFIENDGGFK